MEDFVATIVTQPGIAISLGPGYFSASLHRAEDIRRFATVLLTEGKDGFNFFHQLEFDEKADGTIVSLSTSTMQQIHLRPALEWCAHPATVWIAWLVGGMFHDVSLQPVHFSRGAQWP